MHATSMADLDPARVRPPPGDLMASIGRIAADLAPMAADIDSKGVYPADTLRALGAAGAFGAHLADQTRLTRPDLGFAIQAMAAVAASCMSTAFCMWCQDACGWYLENTTGNAALRSRLQPGIASGALLGGTGLSNPVKALSGIERFALRAERVDGGYIATGVLPWVSNLGDGHWFGTVLQDAADPGHKIMAMLQCGAEGVSIRQNARFIALEGTGTYSVQLRRAFIADADILADPLADMVKRIKPGFILLQSGMGLGVIRACIAQMHAANARLAATNRYLPRQAADFEHDLAELTTDLLHLAATPLDGGVSYVRAVLTARLRCSELALEAAQSALLHHGARAYLEGSAVHRLLRESYFVAIITPSTKHLRQEIELLDQH